MSVLKKSKGQLITSDFVLATIILIIIIQASMSFWNRNVVALDARDERNEIENLALSVADLLIKNPGIPEDWNSSNVVSIGLAEETNVLDYERVLNFTSLSKDKAKELLGIKVFEFIFQLKDTNGNVLLRYGDVPTDPKESVIVRRLVLYKSFVSGKESRNISIMEFGVWR